MFHYDIYDVMHALLLAWCVLMVSLLLAASVLKRLGVLGAKLKRREHK